MFTENFRRATAELIVLHLLSGEDLYAYDLAQQIKKGSKGLYTVPEGTLYPVMYRLSAKGYVTETNMIINKRLRKYYHIEPDGREYYKGLLEEYREGSIGINNILETAAPSEEAPAED